ncbi:MAG TPA: tetratricopeptide repeat protein [Bryobacteraceae bacterium]|nr:tetratricopeptide repeat protein [Bryobacteraceae bacterium]
MNNAKRFRVVLLAAVALAGCTGPREEAYQRIAVLPFEDLSSGGAVHWKGRALGELVAIRLSGLPQTTAVFAAGLPAAAAIRATHVLHGYFDRDGAHASLEEFTAHRTVKTAAVWGSDPAVLSLAIARSIEPAARGIPVTAIAAQAFAEGSYERATAEAPGFGPAYVAWVNQSLARGDRDGAVRALAAARNQGKAFHPLERARLDVFAATLAGDAVSRRKALVALTRADPADAAAFRALAEIDTSARWFQSAAQWFDQALARDPAPEIYNAAGYNRAYAGDLDGAVQLLQRYRELRPGDANALDSLAEVYYHAGRFADAERYFLEAYANNPGFLGGAALYKAAWARLMMGDFKRASAHADKFFAARVAMRDPAAPILQAQWEFVTGRRDAAVAVLEKSASPAASAHLAVWAMDAGDRERARRLAARLPERSSMAAALETALGSEVKVAPGPARSLGLGWAAMLAGRPGEAVPHFREFYRLTPPSSPEPAPVLLAWALIENGQAAEARPLLERNVIPDATADHPFVALAYPRILELRKRAGLK